MKKLISLRISALTEHQIATLQQATGMNQTEIVTVAIDRMSRKEIKMNAYKVTVKEETRSEDEFTSNAETIRYFATFGGAVAAATEACGKVVDRVGNVYDTMAETFMGEWHTAAWREIFSEKLESRTVVEISKIEIE